MKKILTILLIVSIMMSISITAVLAEGSRGNNPFTSPNESAPQFEFKPESPQALMSKTVSQFTENKLEAAELKTQTNATLQQQLLLTEDCKLELRVMNEAYKNMSEAQRAENVDAMEELRHQIKSTHKYNLQVLVATQLHARILLEECIVDETPSEDEIEEVSEVLDEL